MVPEFDSNGRKIARMLRRSAGMSAPQFQNAWLGVGLAAVAGMPGLVRYSQNHALLNGYAKGDLLFDGIEEFVFTDAQQLANACKSDAWARLGQAAGSFVDWSNSIVATVNVSIQKSGIPPAGAIHSAEFVNRRPDLPMADFRRYWLDRHGPLAAHIPQIIRYEQNHLAEPDYAAGAPRFDGWASTWFATTAAMRQAAREPCYAHVRADEVNFLVPPLPVLLTRQRLVLLGE